MDIYFSLIKVESWHSVLRVQHMYIINVLKSIYKPNVKLCVCVVAAGRGEEMGTALLHFCPFIYLLQPCMFQQYILFTDCGERNICCVFVKGHCN